MNAFQALYDNQEGLRDKFVSFWDKVSTKLAANPYVVGYDPINEPYPGNTFKEPLLNKPGYFDQHKLTPMYSEIYDKYIASNKDSMMWFEPAPYPDEIGIFDGLIFPAGFKTPPGGEIGSPNHVFNAHTYCCQMNAAECATGEP